MTEKRGIVVGQKDLIRMKVIALFRERKLNRKAASEQLALSERQISRLAAACRDNGPAGVLHKGRGRQPKNRKPEELKIRLLNLYRNKYPNFNRCHAMEMMLKNGEVKGGEVSNATFNRWCQDAGLGKVKRRRSSRAHVQRERLAEEGAMLQMDGSNHHWITRKSSKDTLIAFIDDATSKVPYMRFHASETTWACFDGLRHVVETEGIPEVILTDRAGWSDRGDKRFHFSQFSRLCEDLGIILVATSSPQTKGRIERLYRTVQDRLVAELEHYGISTRVDGNRYIEQCFQPQWEEKFTVEPKSKTKRYRPVPPSMDLDEHFCMKYERRGNRNNTVSFEGKNYRIQNREFGSLHKRQIKVHVGKTGQPEFYYAGHKLQAELIVQPKRRWRRYAS